MEGEQEAVLERMVREGLLEEVTQELRCEKFKAASEVIVILRAFRAGAIDLQRPQDGKSMACPRNCQKAYRLELEKEPGDMAGGTGRGGIMQGLRGLSRV